MNTAASPLPSPLHPASRGLARLAELAAASPLQPVCEGFYFLRHGQTPRNALRIFQSYDEPLSELGERQAAAAAVVLAREPIRRIVCSDARRALHTAQTVAAPLSLQPLAQALLRERHFGALVGTSSADIDWDCAPEGGETLAEFVQRKRQALEDALATEEGPVLIVAHGGSLYVLAALLGVPLNPGLLANAHPLHFTRGPDGRWQARALSAADPALAAGGALA
ncbi:histidine phosphatase family protein [Xenophilus arseniciresistens]|uniref:Histidine phosphatase family protein n=1 Tax=Xenophilus arseniciresistens TaxID=1283306 RepID=A0AAE3SZ16_9BURK|nr:histidine phosphatase family protein [Xenophilus arseniciresistens]MDA7414817.1 histidine phosphatase family protein [Xenophilus arseniciresistens]